MGYRGPSSIQRYESDDDFRGQYLAPAVASKMAKVLAGRGTPPINEREVLALAGPIAGVQVEKHIPVISFIQAGNWTVVADAYTAGDGFGEITADQKVGPRAFALEIKGTSMFPRFQEGDRIVIDPDVEPIPGDFVVAKEDRDGEATFKQFRPRGQDSRGKPIIELRPLNDVWPTITLDAKNPGRLVGTMVEHHSYRRTP